MSGKFRLGIWFLQCLGKKELLSGVNVPKKTQGTDVLVDRTCAASGLCGDHAWVYASVFVPILR